MKESIKIREENGELVVTSRQVAEDFGKEHKNVVRAIENLTAQNSAVKNIMIESNFYHKGNKYTEYLLTRDGFSLLVMGFTGAKALEWKLKYIDAFNKMEQSLRESVKQLSPMEMMKLQYDVLQQHEAKIIDVENKVETLKDDMPLFNVECEDLQKSLKKKGTAILGGYKSPAYNDCSLRSRVYVDIQNQIKREFGVHSYKAIKRKQIEIAKYIIAAYKAPLCIRDEIHCLNQQIKIDEAV